MLAMNVKEPANQSAAHQVFLHRRKMELQVSLLITGNSMPYLFMSHIPYQRRMSAQKPLEMHTYLQVSKWTATMGKIEVDGSDKEKPALTSHHGLYQVTHLSFGLENAPTTSLRVINIIFLPVKWRFVLVYFHSVVMFCDYHTNKATVQDVFSVYIR